MELLKIDTKLKLDKNTKNSMNKCIKRGVSTIGNSRIEVYHLKPKSIRDQQIT